ncbi:MAG: hypothetical protein AB1793_08225 [Candidatus Thermoplasmatota archaeon]
MLLSEKIFVAMAAWTAASVYVAMRSGTDLLVTLVLIGLLVTRELSDGVLSRSLRRRMAMFIYALLAVFAAVVANRVLEVLS